MIKLLHLNCDGGFSANIGYCTSVKVEVGCYFGSGYGLETWIFWRVILEMDFIVLAQTLEEETGLCNEVPLSMEIQRLLDPGWEIHTVHTLREGNRCELEG